MKATLMIYLNQSIVLSYQAYKKSLAQGSGRIIDSVINHNINILEYNPLAGNSHIKLPKHLGHPRKDLINIQNIYDNEWFKWSLVRYLHFVDYRPAGITKADKDFFEKEPDFKDIKSSVKIREIHRIYEKNSIRISIVGYESQVKYPINVLKIFL